MGGRWRLGMKGVERWVEGAREERERERARARESERERANMGCR